MTKVINVSFLQDASQLVSSLVKDVNAIKFEMQGIAPMQIEKDGKKKTIYRETAKPTAERLATLQKLLAVKVEKLTDTSSFPELLSIAVNGEAIAKIEDKAKKAGIEATPVFVATMAAIQAIQGFQNTKKRMGSRSLPISLASRMVVVVNGQSAFLPRVSSSPNWPAETACSLFDQFDGQGEQDLTGLDGFIAVSNTLNPFLDIAKQAKALESAAKEEQKALTTGK